MLEGAKPKRHATYNLRNRSLGKKLGFSVLFSSLILASCILGASFVHSRVSQHCSLCASCMWVYGEAARR